MNLTDLSAELETQAASVAAPAAMNRLTGVRQRIRTRRRRQVATAAGFTAFCVAAIVLAPGLSGLRTKRSDPAPPTTTQRSNPLVFASAVAGDPLVATAVSTPGQRELVLRFTPTDTNLAMSGFCRIPGGDDDKPSGLTATVSVNGHSSMWGECSASAAANSSTGTRGDVGRENRDGWAKSGVIPGVESVFRVTVTADKPGTEIPAGIRLGIGLYEQSGPRVTSNGVTIQELYESAGHSYRLAEYRTAKLTAKQKRLAINVPAGRKPVQVLMGVDQSEAESTTRGFVEMYVDGRSGGLSVDGGGTGFVPLGDAAAHTAEVRPEAGLRGTMVIAYYVQID